MVQATNQPQPEKTVQPNEAGYYCPECAVNRGVKVVMLALTNGDTKELDGSYGCSYCFFELKQEYQVYDPADLVGYEVGGVMGWPDELA